MRIVHSFTAASLKVTLFQHQAKYSIKVQDAGYEISYPLGDQDFSDLANQLEFYFQNPAIVEQFKKLIQSIHESKIAILSELSADESTFDEIL
jgi:hypothetical protein